MGKTYLRSGSLALASSFPKMPSHLKPLGHIGQRTTPIGSVAIGDMATDGESTIVAVAYDSTIYVSLDRGDSWIIRGKLAAASGYAWSLATDRNGVWLAMAKDGTVVRSTDAFLSWAGTLTPAQAALGGSTTYHCRLDYVNGEFWMTRAALVLNQAAASNTHLYRLSSSGSVLTPMSLPATGLENTSYSLCGVFGNGKNLYAIFNRSSFASSVSSTWTGTYAFIFSPATSTFSAPVKICNWPAMNMLWDEEQKLWLVYANNFYQVSSTYQYSIDVKIYDADLNMVASYSPPIVSSAGDTYINTSMPLEPFAWGDWGVLLKLPRNYCIEYLGRQGIQVGILTYAISRILGGTVSATGYGTGGIYTGAGVTLGRDLAVVCQSNGGDRAFYKIPSYVGLPLVNKPNVDTAMFLRVN
ncbi:hypothetical protein ACUTR7_08255 [Delftia sp. NA_296.1]|uniref:hypothetical protein n=1 Tax=Delftia sp. NA_296.1 TaxID=3415648 RepID=UPI0040465CD7